MARVLWLGLLVALHLVICASWSWGWGGGGAERRAVTRPATTRVTTQPSDGGVGEGLTRSLTRWRHIRESTFNAAGRGWEVRVEGPGKLRDGSVIRQRDAQFGAMVRAVKGLNNSSGLRVVTFEHVCGGAHGMWRIKYSRMGFYAWVEGEPRNIEELDELGLVRIDRAKWARLDAYLGKLMGLGGSDNGQGMIFDAGVDATLVCAFDGKRWRMEAWAWMATLWDLRLTPGQQAFNDLLLYVHTHLGKRDFGSGRLDDWMLLGELREEDRVERGR